MKCLIFSINSPILSEPIMGRILGPHRVAHVLRKNNWDAEVVDFSGSWQVSELQEFFKSRVTADLKFIGFGKLFGRWPDTVEIFLAWIKQEYPDIKVIYGSQFISDYTFSNFIDYYISGFSEYALLDLLKYLFANGHRPKFALNSNKKKIIEANSFYPANDITDLTVSYQDRDFLLPGEWLPIELSRGCKFACSFCDFPFLNVKDDASMPQENFERQIKENYDRFGIQKYSVSDSTFNDRTEKITKFADVIQSLEFDTWFEGFVRADLLISRPKDREELLRMNFLGHFYGIESLNHQSAKSIGKGMHPDKIKEGLISIKDYFLKNGSKRYLGQISLIAGLPYETKETQQETLAWLAKNWVPMPYSISPLLILTSGSKHSEISLDYKKFGYKPMDIGVDNMLVKKITNLARDYGQPLIWQNDHFSMLEAVGFVEEFREQYDNIIRPKIWDMSRLYMHNISLSRALTMTTSEIDSDTQLATEKEFIDRYIRNKLDFK